MANSKNHKSWVQPRLFLSEQFYMVCVRCKLTPKPGYFATILQNSYEHYLRGNFITYSNYSPLVLSHEVLYIWRNTSHATGSVCLFLKAHILCKGRRGQISIYIYITSWRPVLRYGESVFTKENKALKFSLLLNYYVNYRQFLNYVYIDFCSWRRLRRMCAFK